MTRMQYLHLTGVIPRMNRAFENEWEKENRKRFEKNHPIACRHKDKERKKNEKIYQKFNFGRRPKKPLSGDSLIQAIKICSKRPSQCFYLEETLCQLGHYNTYSYEDRFNALLIATQQTGQAILVEEGFESSGTVAVTTKHKRSERFIGENVACRYLKEADDNASKAWSSIRNHRNTYAGLREEDRNAEHYLYALNEVRSGDSSWVKMNILTDGYSIYKGGLNALQTATFGYFKSPFKGSPATWSENLSGHLGADDAIFGVKCDDK